MSFPLFDRIRAFFRSTNLYNHDNLYQNQTDINRVSQDGQLINFATGGLIDQTNLQINRMERYKDFDQMDEMGEISLSLDLYADEGTQIDTERKKSLLVRAKSLRVMDELDNLFYGILNIDNKLRPMMRYLCKYGDFPAEIIPSVNRDSVASFRPFNVYNFTRVETRFGDLIGFFFTDILANEKEPVFLHPWQVMHLRLTSYENIYAPYGRSVLDGARKDFRRLRLMEDAALVYRITRAPEKRVFTIPVGNIPANQVQDYLNQIADNFKRTKFYDPATGEVNWRYNPLIQEDDFWLPQRADGTGPTVDTLQGAENLDQIADIEYFKKKMISALKIPFSRVGIGNDEGVGSDKSLSSVSSEFAKAVQWIQKEMAVGLKKIALVHLALRGFPIDDIENFDLSLTASSAIDELYRIETWNSRVSVINGLKETGMFPDRWILNHFTDMTDDEIEDMQEIQEVEAAKAPEEQEGELPDIGGLPGLAEDSLIDRHLAKNVIAEYANFKNRSRPQSGRPPIRNTGPSFKHLLSENEFDGLPRPANNALPNLLIENDGELNDTQYLIPPNNSSDAVEVIEENKNIIMQDNVNNADTDINNVVMEVDLPGTEDSDADANNK